MSLKLPIFTLNSEAFLQYFNSVAKSNNFYAAPVQRKINCGGSGSDPLYTSPKVEN
jgi:hypothetical protein